MKIINFNQHKKDNFFIPTWKAWNKQYVQALNAKITSLQDYIMYNYPQYMIFNSPTNKQENIINITQLPNPLQQDIAWEVDGKIQEVSLFFPSRLSWRQGFYNQSSYGDGVFVFPLVVDNLTYYVMNWQGKNSSEEFFRYGWRNGRWYQITPDKTNSFTTIQDVTTTMILPADCFDFPSGFVCILNKQPTGENNETNLFKQDLQSYLIAPIGNGAYYNFELLNSTLNAQYTENDLGNFANQTYMNLGQNLRYNIPSTVYIKEKQSFGIPNIIIDEDQVLYNIVDHVGNLWTGGDELVAQTINDETGEDVFMDIEYNIFTWVVKRKNIFNFNISTNERVAEFDKSDMSASMIRLQLF